jgi:hypothetical protein
MGETPTQQAGTIPDLPSGLAEPEAPPHWVWIALRPDLFGLPPWAVAGIYLAEIFLLVLLFQLIWRVLSLAKPRPSAPSLPAPDEEATAALATLRNRANAPVRELAILLSSIVRRFAEREYGIALTTQTQEEFSALLSVCPDALPQRFAAELRAFLDACDQAKFKPGANQEEFKQQLWNQATRLIQKSPKPVHQDESP